MQTRTTYCARWKMAVLTNLLYIFSTNYPQAINFNCATKNRSAVVVVVSHTTNWINEIKKNVILWSLMLDIDVDTFTRRKKSRVFAHHIVSDTVSIWYALKLKQAWEEFVSRNNFQRLFSPADHNCHYPLFVWRAAALKNNWNGIWS